MTEKLHNTFFLPKDWTYVPNDIWVGDIVRCPFEPDSFLSRDRPSKADLIINKQNGWDHAIERSSDAGSENDGQVLKLFRSQGRQKILLPERFQTQTLTTITLAKEPTLEYINERCKDESVRDYVDPSNSFCGSVYMVIAIKVASGFTVSRKSEPRFGTNATTSTTIEDDMVFAYQLIEIKPIEGYSPGKYDPFYRGASFMGDPKEEREERRRMQLEWIKVETKYCHNVDSLIRLYQGSPWSIDCFSIREEESAVACNGHESHVAHSNKGSIAHDDKISVMHEDEDYVIC